MSLPPATVREALWRRLVVTGLSERLGGARLFPRDCWHQSLSGRFWPASPAMINRLRVAGGRCRAEQFSLRFDRIEGLGGHDVTHWAARPDATPKGLRSLQRLLRKSLQMEGVRDEVGANSAHVTLSYDAPELLEPVRIEPVAWTVAEFMLVRGGGSPYRYEVLERRPLTEAGPESPSQLRLL